MKKVAYIITKECCCLVVKSCLTLRPHELQHARLPCPSLCYSCLNSCPLSQWCHTTISSSVVPFSSCLQSFPASGSFPKSQLFTSGGQTIGASALASVLPVSIQYWFPLGLTGLISLLPKGLSRVFSSITIWKHQFYRHLSAKWCLCFFNMLFRLVIAFLLRSKHLLILWLQSPSAVYKRVYIGYCIITNRRIVNWGGAPKSLQMVTTAMKLKDAYSLEEKLWPM